MGGKPGERGTPCQPVGVPAALLPARPSAHPCSVCHMIPTPLLLPSLLDFGADPQKQQLPLFKAGETEAIPIVPASLPETEME